MISWTILPPEEPISAVPRQKTKVLCCCGIPLLVEAEADTYKIIQILSTNPNDYLIAAFQPGKIIDRQNYTF